MDLSRITFVLDKVRHPDNLGSALRAMANSGLDRLTLVDPQTRDFERARVMAVGTDGLLDRMRIEESLAAAVAHGTLVAGTTSRTLEGRPSVPLREFVERANAATEGGGEVVVVFGNEQRGMSDAELDLCQVVVNIPTAPAKTSINLAQAVMIVGHELYVASLGPRPLPPRDPLARMETLQAAYARMRSALLEAEFLNPQNPEDVLSELKRLVERASPTQREAELLVSAFKHLQRGLGLKLKRRD